MELFYFYFYIKLGDGSLILSWGKSLTPRFALTLSSNMMVNHCQDGWLCRSHEQKSDLIIEKY